MLELVDLSQWQTRKMIKKQLLAKGIMYKDRQFRKEIETFNRRFEQGLSEAYIVHSNSKGYKKTSDTKEILESAEELIKRSTNMFAKASATKKAVKELHNMKLELEERGGFNGG